MSANQFSGSIGDLRVVNNLDGAVSNRVNWRLQPVAEFSAWPLAGSTPLSVVFTNLSTGTHDTCAWSFGDGSPGSNNCNPTHTYTVPGIYTPTLTVSGLGGSDSETKAAYISVKERRLVYLPLVVRGVSTRHWVATATKHNRP